MCAFNVSQGGDSGGYMIVEYITRIYVLSFFTQKLMTILSSAHRDRRTPFKDRATSFHFIFFGTPPPAPPPPEERREK